MRILLVEDDSATAQSIALMLKTEGFDVHTTSLGHEGAELGKSTDYDLILLDLDLPDMSGFEVLRSLRFGKVQTPVLILSGFAGVREKAKALGFGADDYLTKPFHKDELVARIHAVWRSSRRSVQSVIRIGDLVVNLLEKTATIGGIRLRLTVKEYEILAALAVRRGSILTKEMLLTQLYGGIDEPGLKIIDVFLCKIRKKVAAALQRPELHRNDLGARVCFDRPECEAGQIAG